MYSTIIEYTSKNFASNNVVYDVKTGLENTQYRGGIIDEVNVLNADKIILRPSKHKKFLYTCDLMLEFKIFSAPSNFYLPNAKVSVINSESQNIANVIFTCEYYINGEKMKISNSIVPIITSDNKSSVEIQALMNLREGDYVNLLVIRPLISCTNTRYGILCNIAGKIDPIKFCAGNVTLGKFAFINDAIIQKIFNMPKTKLVTELKSEESYFMTPCGFYKSDENNATITNLENNELEKYLLAVLDNWKFLIANNLKLEKNDLDTLLRYYEI
jgi:hypothetical protein